MAVSNGVQLITYADSLGGDLRALSRLLGGPLAGLFSGGVHLLPPFPSSGDRGFAPITYFEIDPAFGTWEDIAAIGRDFDLTLDIMVNHVSRQSCYFRDFARRGRASPWADLFVTIDKVWGDSRVPPEDAAKIARRKPGEPFADITIEESGVTERVWCSFGSRDWSEQIDIDVGAAATRELLAAVLRQFAKHGVKMARLDAVGYVTKRRGTSCFFVEPDIYDFLSWMRATAEECGIELLPEVHAHSTYQTKMAERGYWVYDFALPALVLHSLYSASAARILEHLRTCPRRQFTALDCHDGIPIRPDVEDILTVDECRRIADVCRARGANLSRLLSNHADDHGCDVHQVNCTYYDALGRDDDAYVVARAIQLFTPGIPQVYYVGLLAGENDHQGVEATGVGRAINRRNYSSADVVAALQRPAVKRLLPLMRLRNEHPSFHGLFAIRSSDDRSIALEWRDGDAFCSLEVDLPLRRARIRHTDDGGATVELDP